MAQSFEQFLAGNPAASDFLSRQLSDARGRFSLQGFPLSHALFQPGVNLAQQLASDPGAGFQATSQLSNILSREGRTDPRLFNRNLVDIQQGGQAQQTATQGQLAQLGLQRSGIGQAIVAAQGQATENRLAGARAQEAALADERQRQGLQLFHQLFTQPAIDLTALGTGQFNAAANRDQAQQSGNLGALQGFLTLLALAG